MTFSSFINKLNNIVIFSNSPILEVDKDNFLNQKRKLISSQKKSSVVVKNFVYKPPPSSKPILKTPPHTSNKIKNQNVENFNSIIQIDSYFKSTFTENILPLKKQEKSLTWIIENSKDNMEIYNAKQSLFDLKKKARLRVKKEDYISATKDLLEEYLKLENIVKKISFFQKAKAQYYKIEMQKITNSYIMTISRFTKLNLGYLYKNIDSYENICECGNSNFEYTHDDKKVCTSCFTFSDIIDLKVTFRDNERINLVPKYNYSRDSHFKTAIKRFQGKQNTTIKPEIFDIIEKELIKYNIDKKDFTKKLMYCILDKYGYGDCYVHGNLIHWKITGKLPPNISHLEAKLTEMNSYLEEVFEQIKDKERKSALNVNYKLMILLDNLEYVYDSDDLIGLKTDIKIAEHEHTAKKIFSILGWEFKS